MIELNESQLFLLVRAASSERDELLLRVMLECGLTSSEAAKLKKENVLEDALLIEGKRRRKIPAHTRLAARLKKIAGNGKENVFIFSGKRQMLSQRQVQKIVKKHAGKAGLGGNVTPHSLRHAFAQKFIKKNGNAIALAKILGHSTLAGVEKYAKLAENNAY